MFAQNFWEQLSFPDTTDIRCFAKGINDEIFVGTGGSNYPHGSLYYSIDKGNTWSLFHDFNGEIVGRVGVSESGNIYVSKGAQSLVFSENNGVSWNTIELPEYSNLGINEMLCTGIDTVYIGFWEDDGGLLVKTTDNGITWDSLFRTENNSSEYIADILIEDNEIYLGMGAYFPGMGGVYKSVDFGQNWEFLGLLNHSVSSLILNENNDLIAGVRGAEGNNSSGIYRLPQGENEWNTLISGPMVEDLLINEIGDIYFSSSWPQGIGISTNNGDSFEWIADGLQDISVEELLLDDDGYIYANTPGLSNILFRSSNPTVGVDSEKSESQFVIYPNPCDNQINITLDHTIIDNKIVILVYSLSGELILKEEVLYTNESLNLSIDHLSNGIYLLEIISPTNKYITKFIKH